MATERRAQTALRALADETVPPEDAATLERRRRRVVEATALAIARTASEQTKRRRWTRAATVFASAAAAFAIAGGAWKLRGLPGPVADDRAPAFAVGEAIVGTLHRSHEGDPPFPSEPTGRLPLRAGDDIATEPGGRAEVVLADGVAMTLQADTELRLPGSLEGSAQVAREVVRLARGGVSVHVPPMSPGHTFSVATPDAEVTVHGTSFTVEFLRAREAGDTTGAHEAGTRVRVTTGVVSVSSHGHEAVLTAGMEWPERTPARTAELLSASPPRAATPTPSDAQGESADLLTGGRPAPKAATVTPRPARHDTTTAPAPAPRSRLGEENQLLATAIAASKGGDFTGAVATLDDLLRRFPTSTLAQEAHVERFRALAHNDRAAAAREARLYLALYPDGFARDEAKGLAVEW
jgi:ferric-dicitrate binding protein FerR (iron transport regulator)